MATDRPASQRGRQRTVDEVAAVVSEVLGNTPTVSKESYIHPAVVGAFDDGTLPDMWDAGPRRDGYGLSVDERRLVHLLDERG